MKIFKLAAAAALAVSGLAISVAPAAATQRADNMEQRDNMRHDGMRGDNDRHDGMRGDNDRHDGMRHDDRRGDRGRHYGWNHNRGHHYGWRNNRGHRVCRTVWRHHMRQRVCYWR